MREPTSIRGTSRFEWAAVDRTLVQRMLTTVYEAAGRPDEAAQIAHLSRKALDGQAEHALGRPLAARHMDVLLDVLRTRWLPTLPSKALDVLVWDLQLSLSGPDRAVVPTTKPAKLDFLKRRSRTATLKAVLRSAFLRAHKVESARGSTGHGGPSAPDRGARELVGLEQIERRKPYPHQVAAWAALDQLAATRARAGRRGLVVLPTGAGKTYTLVGWLLRRMHAVPATRVLWIADQQELLDQAARSFEWYAETMPSEFTRRLRAIHGNASPVTTLADPDLDVACVTRQSLVGRGLDAQAVERLRQFLVRPCVVVIDEAHHAVSPSYGRLIDTLQEHAPLSPMLGLTATPWPSGAGMTSRLNEQFPIRVADVHVRDLVRSGVLARPTFHTVETEEYVKIGAADLKAAVGRDIPAAVLRGLDRGSRNALIVRTWVSRKDDWGKTLIFACDIEHADHLGDLLREAGVDVSVVHSRADLDRAWAIEEFRRATGPCVLVSVGMLLEGVDIPDARTAFLTRPTTSRVLMRQMIGRVLRGEAGGGEAVAHIVDLRDRWGADVDVLAPVDIPGIDGIPAAREPGQPTEHRLPRVMDELSDEPISEDLMARIRKAYAELMQAAQLPHAAALAETALVGFYELGDLNVPVFDHARGSWAELIKAKLPGGSGSVPTAIDYFDHLPIPRPAAGDVAAVVEFVRAHDLEPPYVEVLSRLSIRGIAQQLLDAGARTESERLRQLEDSYETSLARSEYLSFQEFWEAVQQQLLVLALPGIGGVDPESVPLAVPRAGLTKIGKRADRDLGPLLRNAAARGRALLGEFGETDYVRRLGPSLLPRVKWTRRPVKGAFAYWAPRASSKAKGEPIIRVNCILRAPRSQVPDEMLEYLLWHELCHQLLIGRGHDAEFRWLQSIWPDNARLDHDLDTLQERFDLGWH